MYKVGIDLGGTTTKVAIVDHQGNIVCKRIIPTRSQNGCHTVFHDMAVCIRECMALVSAVESDLDGAGLATPGLLSENGQEILFASNLGFSHVRAVEELSRYFSCPVSMTNDANAAALGEHRRGAGKGSRSSVTLTIGTGIGAGIILDDRIVSGAFYSGGEIGHHIINADGPRCSCGQRGCMELYASASALVADTRQNAMESPGSLLHELCGGDLARLDARMTYQAHYQGDPAATQAVERFIRYLGVGVINTINFLQPEVLIIGGGVSAEKEKLTEPLTEYVKNHILFGEQNLRTRICHALLGNDAGVIGAAMLF